MFLTNADCSKLDSGPRDSLPCGHQWRFGTVMDIAELYRKEAEKCERLAKTCETEIGRAFFMDAAEHWREKALDVEYKEPPSLREARHTLN